MTRTAVAALLLAATGVFAQSPPPAPDLPPLATVEKALTDHPPVRVAREGVRTEEATRRRLQAGPYEFTVRGGYQSHSIPNGRFPELDVGVERGIRLPGKARGDLELGDQSIELARRVAYSAWCDAARQLLRLWFGWARENVQLELWKQQAQALREQVSISARRAAAGDTPRIEVNLAEASAAQAEAVVENFRGREQGARAAVERTFPPVTPPPLARTGRPEAMDQTLDWFIERVRVHNDEIRVARAASRRGLILAKRAAAERVPDPSVGVRIATDRSASDHVAGVYVIVPLPGAARQASADVARSQAAAIASQEAAVVQRVSADVALMYGQAQGAFNAWERARTAADGMQRNAASITRSWQLREASLNDVLIARRLALESGLSAALARIDAEETRYRLMVEAHLLWNDPEEEAQEHAD
ncbi:MAG: TolC family protein [Betaproteobacteria bacterium]